jgi:hypothetical protein
MEYKSNTRAAAKNDAKLLTAPLDYALLVLAALRQDLEAAGAMKYRWSDPIFAALQNATTEVVSTKFQKEVR